MQLAIKMALGAMVGVVAGAMALFAAALLFSLTTGEAMRPAFWAAALAGAALGALCMYEINQDGWHLPPRLFAAWSVLCHAAGLFALAPSPFNEEAAKAWGIWQGHGGAMLFCFALFGWLAALIMRDAQEALMVSNGAITRHALERCFIRLLRAGGFLFFGIAVGAPFFIMLLTSLKSQQALLQNPLDFSLSFTDGAALFRSYSELFTDYHFGVFMANTALVSLATVIITLAFSVPGAYAVARLRFRGKRLMARSILLIYMVPAIVLVIPLYAAFSALEIRNSFWGLLIAYPATTIPVALYMLQGYFRELPAELEEAGLIDGLGRWRVIWHITLPLSLPALASVSLYVFMIAWNEFLFAFMFLDDPSLFTLSRGVMSLNSSEVPRQHLMAGAVASTLPVLILFLGAERFLIKGLAAGGVKG